MNIVEIYRQEKQGKEIVLVLDHLRIDANPRFKLAPLVADIWELRKQDGTLLGALVTRKRAETILVLLETREEFP